MKEFNFLSRHTSIQYLGPSLLAEDQAKEAWRSRPHFARGRGVGLGDWVMSEHPQHIRTEAGDKEEGKRWVTHHMGLRGTHRRDP
ncbi:hypothetical protein NGA_0725200 [Nannochloropsis gaditana CCMP526]|uniref:uncharacterized protein n=1 Tax=Nannochloropsis gaditana (strain CCMP526) TaxID=1093141 RepID=UPI00029F5FB0|nr:hypothetical protein NGA_0725200 [Nannochloropsis gaditana CCMP526]EKU23305.1 hypothetical protein NGA_0725200 [Nannochloropsis gaditana CCMP526]|eukprot:XP_005852527.1 hypothetical protein NGA_0725200 [Nannochloropsis gaditana CCMP526]